MAAPWILPIDARNPAWRQFYTRIMANDFHGALCGVMSKTGADHFHFAWHLPMAVYRRTYRDSYTCECGAQHWSGTKVFVKHQHRAVVYMRVPKLRQRIARAHWALLRKWVKTRGIGFYLWGRMQETVCAPGGKGRKRDRVEYEADFRTMWQCGS